MTGAVTKRAGRKPRTAHPLANEVVVALKAAAKSLDRRDPDRACLTRAVAKGGTISLSTLLSLASKLEIMPGDLLAQAVETSTDALNNLGQDGEGP